MSITYEANLNCDGKDCKTLPITVFHKVPRIARRVAFIKGASCDWVIREGKHYCPDCAEIVDSGFEPLHYPQYS